jgi:hypothetical protein
MIGNLLYFSENSPILVPVFKVLGMIFAYRMPCGLAVSLCEYGRFLLFYNIDLHSSTYKPVPCSLKSKRPLGADGSGADSVDGYGIKRDKTDMGHTHEQRTTRKVFHRSSRWLREPYGNWWDKCRSIKISAC